MTDKLKPCPFCGSKALTNIFLDYEDIENLPTNVIDDYEPEVTCENERCIYGWWLSPKDWNTRPIEDALRKRIAELEAAHRWIPVSERLPECEKDVLVFWGKALDGSKVDWFGTAWRNDSDDGKWCTDPIVPTHWMPLPKLPEVHE